MSESDDKADVYFTDKYHGIMASRYTNFVPAVGDRVSFLIGDETKAWKIILRSWRYEKDRMSVHLFMEEI